MTPPRGTCEFCGGEITRMQVAAYPVSGWEVERSQGGANQITGKRREPDRIAHVNCLHAHLRSPQGAQLEL